MSETHVHMHAAHEHALEHKAAQGNNLAQWVAILSALLACFAAVVGYQSASKENHAILHKNEAIIKTAQASDLWAFYQAKKTKAHLMEVTMALSSDPQKIADFKKELDRYNKEALEIQAKANTMNTAAKAASNAADEILEPHEKLAQAMILLQIAISLASIVALTRKRWLLIVSVASALAGVGLACYGWW
jgi:hypothetical protein